jgi:alcohol dehydrogenase (cytochrome c)
MADARQNYGATGALLVVNDLVIAGISAGDEGCAGSSMRYRASTGERVWRFWTVPARGEPDRKRGLAKHSNTGARRPG